MTLNPVQFGTEVIDQFGRYLMTTFPIADRDMEEQVRAFLKHGIGGENHDSGPKWHDSGDESSQMDPFPPLGVKAGLLDACVPVPCRVAGISEYAKAR